jgi:hypothetical protein
LFDTGGAIALKVVSRRKIPLTNTQNKSEEDVLQALQFFCKEYKKETGQVSL